VAPTIIPEGTGEKHAKEYFQQKVSIKLLVLESIWKVLYGHECFNGKYTRVRR
jgi:hypothetical protein